MLEPKKLPQVVDQKKAAQGVAAIMLWGFICFSGYFFCSFSKEQDAKKLASMLADPQDDAELSMAKFGMPTVDEQSDSTGMMMRHLKYEAVGVDVVLVCDGKQEPCGRHWKLFAFADLAPKKNVLKVPDALSRLRPLLRREGTAKEFDLKMAEAAPVMAQASAIAMKAEAIDVLKRAGLIKNVVYRKTGAEVRVRGDAFLGLSERDQTNICTVAFEIAKFNFDTAKTTTVLDQRTSKKLGSCGDGLSFELAD